MYFLRGFRRALMNPCYPEILLERCQAHQHAPETRPRHRGAREVRRGPSVTMGAAVHRELQAGRTEVSTRLWLQPFPPPFSSVDRTLTGVSLGRLIPFMLVVIIAEELIPVMVIYAPFLLPSTCLLPSQKERIDNKRREKQKNYLESMRPVFHSVHSRAVSEPELSADALLKDRSVPISYLGYVLFLFGNSGRRTDTPADCSRSRASAFPLCGYDASRST